MSFLSRPFFSKSRLKSSLLTTRARVRINKNKAEERQGALAKEIASLLRNNKEAQAMLKAEFLIVEENKCSVFDVVETICEILASKLMCIASHKTCPQDLARDVASIIYCQPRLEIQELGSIRRQLQSKYGKRWIESCLKDEGALVRPDLVEKLSARAPSQERVFETLEDVSHQFDVNWIAPANVTPVGELMSRPFVPFPSELDQASIDAEVKCGEPSPVLRRSLDQQAETKEQEALLIERLQRLRT